MKTQERPLIAPGTVPGQWWHPLVDGRIQCDLCPRACKLGMRQRGFCFVRENIGGRMALTAYGRTSGFCIDPIEKKPLNHFYPGSASLSFGTAGCNLGCRFCQNWNISKARESVLLSCEANPEDIARAARKLGCRSVSFTYNDPVIFAEFAIDVAEACHAEGVAAIAVTAGHMTGISRPEFFRHMDAANVDLKGFTDSFYRKVCAGQLAPVLETLKYLRHQTTAWLEVTTLLIPGENDSEEELNLAAEWFSANLGADVPWHFSAFHPSYKMLGTLPTPPASLARARSIARAHGLMYVYTGNIHDPVGGSTWCPHCGHLVIGRDGYSISRWQIKNGACAVCGFPIAGHFSKKPGTWDGRSQPVRLPL